GIEVVDAPGDGCERGAVTELGATRFAVEGCTQSWVAQRSHDIVIASQNPAEPAAVDRILCPQAAQDREGVGLELGCEGVEAWRGFAVSLRAVARDRWPSRDSPASSRRSIPHGPRCRRDRARCPLTLAPARSCAGRRERTVQCRTRRRTAIRDRARASDVI